MTYLASFDKYATFSGRATRSEFWTFYIINLLIVIVLRAFSEILADEGHEKIASIILGVEGLFELVILLPCLTVAVRRLHDIGKSGWWLLIMFIPFGGLFLLIWVLRPSDPEENEYDHPRVLDQDPYAAAYGIEKPVPPPEVPKGPEIKIMVNGTERIISKQQLFTFAAKGKIDPTTTVFVDGKLYLAGKIKGIVFGPQQ